MKVKYKLKFLIPIVTMLGGALSTSCGKGNSDPEATKDIELKFDNHDGSAVSFENLQKYANDKSVRTIYMVPTDHWDGNTAHNITYLRNNFLEPRLNISPKIHGRGNFDFALGEASKVPADSLWYVKNGWTINKR